MESSKRPKLKAAPDVRAEERRRRRARVEAAVRAKIVHHAPELAAGEPNAGLGAQSLKKILEEIESIPGTDTFRVARRALERLLREMQKKTKGEVRLPTPVVSMPRKSSPFRPKDFRHVPWLSQAIESFTRDLEQQPSVDDKITAARILFSAIVFGGLLNQTLVERFPLALEKSLCGFGDICWIDIPLTDDTGLPDRVRRWFPDPVTQCLIARWVQAKCTWPKDHDAKPGELLWALLEHLSSKPDCSRRDLQSRLLKAARVRARLLLPGILVDFLQSEDHGQSLPAHAWWRVAADHHLEKVPVHKSEEDIAQEFCSRMEISESPPTSYRPDSSEDLSALVSLKACLKRGKSYLGPTAAKRSIGTLRATLGERGPMFTALLDWTDWLLHLLSTGERRAKPQSIHRYLGAIAKPLICCGGEIDPEKTPTLTLESMYRRVLTSIKSSREREFASVQLRDFHTFLMLTREVAPVEIDGEIAGTRVVKANFISECQYLRTLEELNRIEVDTRTRAMRRVMLILAYRAGPRRSELTYLRIADLQAGLEYTSLRPLLWIHSHPDASLKTYSSLRRLPLAHLLTPDELNEVRDWLGIRLPETSLGGPSQALLFCERGTDTEPLRYTEFDLLTDLLRRVCEDDSIVFHTLRHSYISNLFLHIFIAELEVRTSRSVTCPWLRGTDQARFLRRLFRTRVLPREGAYLLSALAGHIDPAETMHTYVHFQDWIAGLFLKDLAASRRVSLWAAMERISPEALMVRHSREKARTKTSVLPHIDTPRRMLKALNLVPPPGHAAPETLPPPAIDATPVHLLKRLPLEGVYSALALANRSMGFSHRELLTGIDRTTYSRLLRAASTLARTETSTRNKDARRPRVMAPRIDRKRPQLSRLPQLESFGPAIPRPDFERSDARDVFQRAVRTPNDQTTTDDLWFLLSKTSHSDPILRLHSVDDVNRAVSLLSRLGIPRRRIALEIKSVPRESEDPQEWFRDVASRTQFVRKALIAKTDPELLPRSIKRHPEGVMALRVNAAAPKRAQIEVAPKGPTLAYGWRVGCFYSLCVLRALMPSAPVPIQ